MSACLTIVSDAPLTGASNIEMSNPNAKVIYEHQVDYLVLSPVYATRRAL